MEQEALAYCSPAGRLRKFTTISSFFPNRSSLLWAWMMDLMSSTFSRLRPPPQKAFKAEPRGSSLPLRYLHVWQPCSCSRDGAAGMRAFNIFLLLWEMGAPVRWVGGEAAGSAPVERARMEEGV